MLWYDRVGSRQALFWFRMIVDTGIRVSACKFEEGNHRDRAGLIMLPPRARRSSCLRPQYSSVRIMPTRLANGIHLPVLVLCSVERCVLGFGEHVENVVSVPGIGVGIVLH